MAEARRLDPRWGAGKNPGSLQSEQGGELGTTELDRLIHERIRLGIVSALAVNETMSFTELRTMLGATDGNLSVHARKLEEAGYIDCTKTFNGRVPQTDYRLTDLGRRELTRYLDHMEALIQSVRAP